MFILCSYLHDTILIEGDNTLKMGGEAVLREMYEQFVFSEASEVERLTQGTSPFVKFAFKSTSCIMIAEFSEVLPLSVQSIDTKLMLGETELLSLTFIPRCKPEN